MSVRLADVLDVLDEAYPPHLASDWDAVGLVCGDPAEAIESVTVAVDATAEVVDAVGRGGLLLSHHPLLLRGVHSVAADDPKGMLVHRLIRRGAALFTAHTNADAANPGVSDALAEAVGLTVEEVLDTASDRGAAMPAGCGIGRIGSLPSPERFADLVARVAAALPATAWGVRAAGDPDRPVSRVAVCGGAGDSLLSTVESAGVQAYLTADLRHHPADEHRRAGAVGLIDVAHWASEFPWCAQAAELLRARFGAALAVTVNPLRTDPWNLAVAGSSDEG